MKVLIFILMTILIVSCVETPSTDINESDVQINKNSIIVLSEGLWGMNNAQLSSIDIASGTMQSNVFERANDTKIGDVANSIAIKGDTAYIVVTSSHYLLAMDIKTAKLIDVLEFPEDAGIRDIVIANDSIAFVSDFYLHKVHEINLKSLTITNSIDVGPAPEGMDYYNGKLYVANSGFGDYLAKEPNAGTISVIDIVSGHIDYHYCGPNIIDLVIDNLNSKLYAAYRHLPSKVDSLGGIVEFDLNSMERLREIRIDKENLNICIDNKDLYYISGSEFGMIKTDDTELTKEVLLTNDGEGFWYSLNVSSDHGLIAIGNAKNYQTKGVLELFLIDNNYSKISKYTTGINPGTILFY